MMNILIDNIIFSLQKSGGISVVFYELLRRLQQETHISLKYVDNNAKNNFFRKRLDIPDSKIVYHDIIPRLSSYFPLHIKNKERFIFHSSYYRYCCNKNAINVTTVHDFTYEYFRSGLKRNLHSFQKNIAIRHSDYIVCISENTKKDLLKFVPEIDENKIRVIYNGVSPEYFVLKSINPSDVPFQPKTFVVFVGNHYPHKNFDIVKKTISKTNLNLLVVGHKFSLEEEKDMLKYLPKSRFISLGYVSNKHLNIIYNSAKALVYPSSYEGFGIPVIEAQKAGCPVIALNSSSIPEVIGNTPLLMDVLTETELISKLELLNNEVLIKEVINDGLLNATRFSWEKMFDDYMDLYTEAYSK